MLEMPPCENVLTEINGLYSIYNYEHEITKQEFSTEWFNFKRVTIRVNIYYFSVILSRKTNKQ